MDEVTDRVPERVPLVEPRALTPSERELLDFLVNGPVGRDELRAQAASATVTATCSCGCPSVWLEVDSAAPSAVFTDDESVYGRADAVDITARAKQPTPAEVTLHVVSGRLFELEIYGGDGVRPEVSIAALEHVPVRR